MKHIFYLVRRLFCWNFNAGRILRLAEILGMLVTTFDSQAQNAWRQKANFGGAARFGAVAFVINGKGYIGTGGAYPDLYNDLWEYDPGTDAWSQKANFGGPARYFAVGFALNGDGYIGTGNNNISTFKDFWEYDPAANMWKRKADFGGTARYGAVGFAINGNGYIGTGNSIRFGLYLSDLWEYNSATDAWTRKADFAGAARSFAAGFSVNGNGYIGTGSYDHSGVYEKIIYYNDFYEYDPAIDTWTRKADFGGVGRNGASAFSINDKGYIGIGQHQIALDDFWEYDPEANTWIRQDNFGGAARYGAAGFSVDSKGYIVTGGSAGYFNDLWEYAPDRSGYTANSIVNVRNEDAYSSCRLEQDAERVFNLYPNPSSGTFHLDLTTVDEGNVEAKIEVLNALGQIIFSDHAQFSQGKLLKEIKLNGASPGMYLVKVIAGDLVYTSQISLQK